MGFTKGEFGGSAARARWRLIRVSASLWIFVLILAALLYSSIGTSLWLLPEVYLSVLVMFQIWHWAAHQRWLFYPMWKVHMYHHWTVYPPKKFLSKVYKNDKAGRTTLTSLAHDGPLYLGILSNIALIYFADLARPLDCLAAILFLYAIATFTNFIHHVCHIEGHWIEKFVYFHDLRALHYTHHQGTALHNFGILDFSGDLAGHALFAPNYAMSNRKPDAKESAELLGKGDEHQSTVHPGPLPTLARDGLMEVGFYLIALSIELTVGFLGLVFGVADDKQVKKKKVTDIIEKIPAKRGKLTAQKAGETPVSTQDVPPSYWGDFFLFN